MRNSRRLLLFAAMLIPAWAYGASYTCVSLEYPPLIRTGDDGKPEGLAVELVSRVFRQLGHTLKVEIYPWARSLELVRTGQADCVFTAYRSPDREQFLDFSNEPIVPQIVYLYARKDSKIAFDGNLDSLKGLRVGTAHKVLYGARFEEARSRLDIYEAPTIELIFQKLAHGRVDVVPSNVYTATATLAALGLRDSSGPVVKLPTPVEIVPSFIGFSKQRKLTALRDGFDAEFRKMLASGECRQLFEKYRIESTAELARFFERSR
ncbi:MAG TPA: transporter substrate-binding domain-containing protein [Paucimonas sp.]|nr:transporter substrate-binding domain-containing protein [Paucimonas sp.]